MPYFGSSPRNTNTRSVIDHQSYLGSQADTSTNSGYYTFYCNYTIGNVSVILRGVHMADSDYTATNGTDIRIATSSFTLNNDDVIEIIGHTVPSSQILERSDVNITGGAISNAVLNNTNTYNFLDNSISGDKIDGGTISDSVLKLKSTGDSIVASDGTTGILSESAGAVTLTADEANVGSNALVVNSSGNVGIGTSSPAVKLDISDTSGSSLLRVSGNASGATVTALMGGSLSGYGVFGAVTNHATVFITNNTERMRISSSGALILAGSTAQKASGTTWTNPSDIRLKENISNYSKGISDLIQIQVKQWEYNGKAGTVLGQIGLGVIADEIESVLPNTVDTYSAKLNEDDETETDIKKFDATEITWLLVNTCKEQQALIESQQSQIDALTARIEALEARN